MLTVRGFQVALNHEDPEIVSSGLIEFTSCILSEHQSVEKFGYNCRSSYAESNGYADSSLLISPQYPDQILGLLQSFLKSSPELEELFVLWDLPGRDEDKKLSANHTKCFAAILFCIYSNHDLSLKIALRLLKNHIKSFQKQLNSGNTTLIHSTLGLLISVSRISNQFSKDIYQKVIIISMNQFSKLCQTGKSLSYEVKEGVKIQTDSRYLIILLLCYILKTLDESILTELFSDKSILRFLTASLHKDSLAGVKLLLESFLYLLPDEFLYRLFDKKLQEKIFLMYGNSDSDIQRIVHSFVLSVCNKVIKSKGNLAHGKSLGTQIMKQLSAYKDIRHREVIIQNQNIYSYFEI